MWPHTLRTRWTKTTQWSHLTLQTDKHALCYRSARSKNRLKAQSTGWTKVWIEWQGTSPFFGLQLRLYRRGFESWALAWFSSLCRRQGRPLYMCFSGSSLWLSNCPYSLLRLIPQILAIQSRSWEICEVFHIWERLLLWNFLVWPRQHHFQI